MMNNIGNSIFLILCLSLAGGSFYLAKAGVWGESKDVEHSVRVGSTGGGYGLGGRVK